MDDRSDLQRLRECDFITVSTAAQMLHLSEKRVRQLVDAGKIASARVANIRVIERSVVMQLAEERRGQ